MLLTLAAGGWEAPQGHFCSQGTLLKHQALGPNTSPGKVSVKFDGCRLLIAKLQLRTTT